MQPSAHLSRMSNPQGETRATDDIQKMKTEVIKGAGVGGGAGAAVGALVGSVVPGVGTLVGGAIGGLIGAMVGGWDILYSCSDS